MKKTERQFLRKAPRSFFRHVIPRVYSFSFLTVFSLIFPSLSLGEAPGNMDKNVPLWWPDTQKRAEASGYKLINFQELQALIQSEKGVILLDARPDYEYRDGHIPGARHFEFHLGHKYLLEPERAEALKVFLGRDREQWIVTYCRNFR
jgi:Rhodanese-like domain